MKVKRYEPKNNNMAPSVSRTRKFKKLKPKKRTYYESPLKHIRESINRRKVLSPQKSHKPQKKRKRLQSLDEEIPHVVNDSVIVLSDTDAEDINCQNGATTCNTNYTQNKNDFGIKLRRSLRCLHNAKQQSDTNDYQRKKRRKTVLEKTILLSDNEDVESQPMPNENIEPRNELHQTFDDITVVWSSAQKSETYKKDVQNDETNRIFMVDKCGDLHNLECLKSETELPPQRQKMASLRSNTIEPHNEDETRLPISTSQLRLPACEGEIVCPVQPLNSSALRRSIRILKNRNGSSRENMSTEPYTYSQKKVVPPGTLREIIIDGMNVSMEYTKSRRFSEEGLKLVIDYFLQRGHIVKAFVPQHKRSLQYPLLEDLYKQGIVIFTPSRRIDGKYITPYDDRFILQYATLCGGIVVSLDQYRDLYEEKPEWRDTILNRLLAPTFVGEYVMFPEDPLGRRGPTLDEFLRH